MKTSVSSYMARIGRRGGLKSRRVLARADAMHMVQIREARRLYRRFHARCFWSYPEELKIGAEDIDWVAAQLRQHGGSEGWERASRLCR